MPLIGQISAMLSADNSDFRSKMGEAGQAVEGFDKQVKKFGLGFGGVAALATAFRAIVDYARDLQNPMDENLKRAKAFAEGLDDVKKGLLDIGARVLGVVNGLGEWWGRLIAIRIYGKEQVELGEEIERQTQETLAALEKHKQISAEIGRIRKETRDVEEKTAAEQYKQLDIIGRMANAQAKVYEAADALAAGSDDRLARAKNELAYAQAQAEVEKLRDEQAKKTAEQEKKAAADVAKEQEKHVETLKKIQQLKWDQLPIQEKIKTYEESIRTVSALISENKRKGVIDDELTLALMQNQLDLADARRKQAEEQARAEEKVTKEIEAQNEALKVGFTIRGKYDDQLSDLALSDKIRTLSQSIQAREASLRYGGGVGGGGVGYDPLLPFEQGELDRAKAELQARQNIRTQVSRYGEEGASRLYSGNIPEFERLLSFVKDQPDAKRSADLLSEINNRLQNNGWFPKR